ncbi:hypothetical protein ACFYTC_36525 [Actinomadura nitritigenes]|uniref:hypothetical protein n=1 Tax=Actinomadura nitritigenes TaxID=134602 RepID=UPI003696CF9B
MDEAIMPPVTATAAISSPSVNTMITSADRCWSAAWTGSGTGRSRYSRPWRRAARLRLVSAAARRRCSARARRRRSASGISGTGSTAVVRSGPRAGAGSGRSGGVKPTARAGRAGAGRAGGGPSGSGISVGPGTGSNGSVGVRPVRSSCPSA